MTLETIVLMKNTTNKWSVMHDYIYIEQMTSRVKEEQAQIYPIYVWNWKKQEDSWTLHKQVLVMNKLKRSST